jgi:hypothetical protein
MLLRSNNRLFPSVPTSLVCTVAVAVGLALAAVVAVASPVVDIEVVLASVDVDVVSHLTKCVICWKSRVWCLF